MSFNLYNHDTTKSKEKIHFFASEPENGSKLVGIPGEKQMPMSILYWVVWIVALIFVGYSGRGDMPGTGRSLVFFVLTGLLGWAVFGSVIK